MIILPLCQPLCLELRSCFAMVDTGKEKKKNTLRLVTLADHTSDHGKQTNSNTKEKGEQARKLLEGNAKSYRLKLKVN